jgi:hypothetical protein
VKLQGDGSYNRNIHDERKGIGMNQGNYHKGSFRARLQNWWYGRHRGRYSYLLLSQILLLAISPVLISQQMWGAILTATIGTLVCLGGIYAFATDKRHRRIVLSSALTFIVFAWLDATFHATIFSYLHAVFGCLFFFYAASALLWRVWQEERITMDVLSGAASVYLLLGIFWSFLYALVELILPGSFAGAPVNYVYYSFTALTSTGFGDIAAVSGLARSATILECVTGPLFIALQVGRLVGIQITQSGGHRSKAIPPKAPEV